MQFELGMGYMDDWYIHLNIATNLTIRIQSNTDNPLRFHIFKQVIIFLVLSE